MGEFEADDADDDEEDGDEPDDVIGIAKEEDSANDGARCTDPCPHGVGGSNGDALHGLGNGEKAEDDEDDGNYAGNYLGEPLAEFKRDCKADFEKTCEQKKYPSNRHMQVPIPIMKPSG